MTSHEKSMDMQFKMLVLDGLKLIANLFIAHATKNLGGSEKMQVSNFSRKVDDFERESEQW